MSDPATQNARLVWHKADGTTEEFALAADANRIGRGEEVSIYIDEPLISRVHAEIACENGQFVLRDLGSTNLTKVNDCTITRCALHDGDEIRFARARCVFLCAPGSEPVPPAAEAPTATETTPD
jgi:pSer/pThr/pTyr-binding forkhead associated (FHA) protein